MGKGDRKTLKGKRYNSSYGNSRSKGLIKATGTATAPVVKKAAGSKTVAIIGFALAPATLNTGVRYFSMCLFTAATYTVNSSEQIRQFGGDLLIADPFRLRSHSWLGSDSLFADG